MAQFTAAFEALSGILAFFAAYFWWKASVDKSPDQISSDIRSRGGADIFGSDQVNILRALIYQGRLNARAAMCAGGSAFMQVIIAMADISRLLSH